MSNSLEAQKNEKSLKEMKKELNKKREELLDLEKIVGEKSRGSVINAKNHLKSVWTSVLERIKLGPETEIIIEEFGSNQDHLSLEFYLDKGENDGKADFIGRYSEEEFPKLGGRKFLEESLAPIEEHDHGHGIKHRVWRINEEEAKAILDLTSSGLGVAYEEGGWIQFKRCIEHLKKSLNSPFEHKEAIINLIPYSMTQSFDRLFRQAEEYAQEKDLEINGATISLILEKEDFAEKYHRLKENLNEMIVRMNETFSPYWSKEFKQEAEVK